jgi:hypothetical protein
MCDFFACQSGKILEFDARRQLIADLPNAWLEREKRVADLRIQQRLERIAKLRAEIQALSLLEELMHPCSELPAFLLSK